MRVLQDVVPTPEQLAIVSRNKPGTELIRGAAGSGKTTTALLRLKSLIGAFVSRQRRLETKKPVRALVLTYNRTLRGYIEALARRQVTESPDIDIEVSTFSRWAREVLGRPPMPVDQTRKTLILQSGEGLGLDERFLLDEVDYVLGRFTPERLNDYLGVVRDGRGAAPRVDRPLRQRLLRDVITPYREWKRQTGVKDWNDLAVDMLGRQDPMYEIVVADEVQDFSANQIRAITHHLAPLHSLTLILDTAQRIYARGFTWQEAGILLRPENSRRLSRNYRNTVEIARFAAPLVDGIPMDDDATIPDFTKCDRHGPLPIVLKGLFGAQMQFVVEHIKRCVDLEKESVAFLHPLGWFDYVKACLSAAKLDHVIITREAEWPVGEENIALSTFHSAKGLEFDHVVMIGMNSEVLPHGDDEADDRRITLRRLVAMGVGRARKTVIVGYKPGDASALMQYLAPNTYEEITL